MQLVGGGHAHGGGLALAARKARGAARRAERGGAQVCVALARGGRHALQRAVARGVKLLHVVLDLGGELLVAREDVLQVSLGLGLGLRLG